MSEPRPPADPAAAAGPALPEPEVARALRLVTWDGMAAQAMSTLAGGVFLTAYALDLGASNTVIGLIAAIPFLGQVTQLPGILLIERLRRRRAVTVWMALFGRLALFAVACAVLLPPAAGLAVLVAGMAVQALFGAVSGVAWTSWMRDLVPSEVLGRYFGRRLFLVTLTGAALSYGAAEGVDLWRRAVAPEGAGAYAVLFALAGVFGLVSCGLLAATPEPPMPPVERPQPFRRLLAEPLRDGNFRRLVVFLGLWNFAANLAAPFFTVHMLTVLGLDMATIIPLTIVSQAVNLAFLRIWGPLADRFSNKSVLAVSCPVFLASVLGWTFTTFPDPGPWTLPLLYALHAAMGLATAGVTLATGNIALKLSPRGQATAYLALNGTVSSLAAGVAPVLGGLAADWFARRSLAITVHWQAPGAEVAFPALHFSHWDFYFLTACVLGLVALHRLSLVTEEGEVDHSVFLRRFIAESFRGLYVVAPVAGLRMITAIPAAALLRRGGRRRGGEPKKDPDAAKRGVRAQVQGGSPPGG